MLGQHAVGDADSTCWERITIADPGCRARISLGGDEALVGVGRRHADVDDRDVGLVLVDGAQQLVAVVGLRP